MNIKVRGLNTLNLPEIVSETEAIYNPGFVFLPKMISHEFPRSPITGF
jgi:hypothetical protein